MERYCLPLGVVVVELKDSLRAANGLLIATPEYNRGSQDC
jgi:hypothetical protein